jgi:thioredoxin-related protein
MNKMKNKTVPLLILMFLYSLGSSYAQVEDALTFQQLDSMQKIEQKPVLVFIHTSWCKYCKAMEQITFQSPKVRELLEKKFYFVELNAEEKKDISVQGHTFRYRPTGAGSGQHELAQELGMIDGKISYPTLCFLNPDYEIIYQNPGFLTAEQFIKMLRELDSNL